MFKKLLILGLFIFGTYHLGNYLIKSGEFDKFLDKHPNPDWVPALEYYMGQFHALFANWDKAIYRFGRVTKKFPNVALAPKVQYALAKTYDDKGAKASAIKGYLNLIKLYPKSEYVEISKKRVTYLRGF
jgi:TolA-binding protein